MYDKKKEYTAFLINLKKEVRNVAKLSKINNIIDYSAVLLKYEKKNVKTRFELVIEYKNMRITDLENRIIVHNFLLKCFDVIK